MMNATVENTMRIARTLSLNCFGSVTIQYSDKKCRKIVGLSPASPGRRDFVHLSGTENNTVLSAQVYFVYQTRTYTYVLARIRTVCIRAI